MGLALDPVARFMTRNLYAILELRGVWCDMLTVTQAGQMEIDFWAKSIESYNGQPIWRGPSAVHVAYSDASDTGYGGYMVCIEHMVVGRSMRLNRVQPGGR